MRLQDWSYHVHIGHNMSVNGEFNEKDIIEWILFFCKPTEPPVPEDSNLHYKK